jgi:hypothetical protein
VERDERQEGEEDGRDDKEERKGKDGKQPKNGEKEVRGKMETHLQQQSRDFTLNWLRASEDFGNGGDKQRKESTS